MLLPGRGGSQPEERNNMTKRKSTALMRIGVIANQLRGEPQNIVGKSKRNWHLNYRLNCIGKALLACVEILENPTKDASTFEGTKDGADIYFNAAMTFLKPKSQRR